MQASNQTGGVQSAATANTLRHSWSKGSTRTFDREDIHLAPNIGSSEKEICEYLLNDHVKKETFAIVNEEGIADIQTEFLNQVFSILVAFIVSQFFVQIYSGVMYKVPVEKRGDSFWTRGLWFALVYLFFPLSRFYLSAFKNGSRRRTVLEDACLLWKESSFVMIVWAFKDVCVTAHKWIARRLVKNSDHPYPNNAETMYFTDYGNFNEDQTLRRVFSALGADVLTFSGAMLFAVVATTVIQWYRRASDLNPDARWASEAGKTWLEHPPFLLGVGVTLANIGFWPYYFFPTEWVNKENNVAIYVVLVRVVVSTMSTMVSMALMRWNDNRQKTTAQKRNVRNVTIRLFVKSLPFMVSWQWSRVGYDLFFFGLFGCTYPWIVCGPSTFCIWIGYACLLTGISYKLVPQMRTTVHVMKELNNFYARTLLTEDSGVVANQTLFDELILSFLCISTGWAWTYVAEVECVADISATCPDVISLWSTIKYAVVALAYLTAVVVVYHMIMMSVRLRARMAKVRAIEEGNSHRLFAGIDDNEDGTITKEELTSFLYESGLHSDLFTKAFEIVDMRDGSLDHHVDTDELMRAFTDCSIEAKIEDVLAREEQEVHEEDQDPCCARHCFTARKVKREISIEADIKENTTTATANPLTNDVDIKEAGNTSTIDASSTQKYHDRHIMIMENAAIHV